MLTLHWAAVRNRYAPICIVRSGVLSRGKPILPASPDPFDERERYAMASYKVTSN